jgi:predicted DNA-binding WGR domain protein
MEKKIIFKNFLTDAFAQGQYATDDVIAFVLPLFEEVLGFHENNLVAPFENESSLFITDLHLDIDETFSHSSKYALSDLKQLFAIYKTNYLDIVGKSRLEANVDDGTYRHDDLAVQLSVVEPLKHPAYIPGYTCFEILIGHHDAQTDIFCLGLILGSMALSLDLYDPEDIKLFAQYRTNPVQFNQRIHPTISSLITEMTELDRQKRSRDLYDIIHRLRNYRDYDPNKETDLSNISGWVNKELKERSQFILSKLRNRLFDTSRRNRLLFYKSNMRFVNLTVSSVPMVVHYQSIRADLLFTWNTDISSKVKDMKEIILNKYLRFEDHVYLSSALDKIRVESNRDVHEYGFSQLKLVIAFLNWHNLRENSSERIQSPLLLIPVELKKNKKLKEDHFVLKVLDNAAEVNPVLANQLRELYGIRLPDFVDLDDMSLEEFYKLLKAQIDAANQGIRLNYIDKPRIKLIHSVAKQTVSNYRKRLRSTGGLNSYKNIPYSYQQENYKPLGLEIFRQRVEHRSTFLEFLINEDIRINSQQLTGNNTKERELFELSESESNPYSWDFDICNMVLGNFNYKKMSLVRDYNNVIDNNLQHSVFESLFSNKPKKISTETIDLTKTEDWHHVITADPTQTRAILQSHKGESYIIQGPPGTGKSQTITNLVADFVARGKSVLFICEKRAALDVVYHRLKQNGLDELCCYIHDSQSDKREFIRNLKATYEDFTKSKMDLASIRHQRNDSLKKINSQLEIIGQFHFANSSIPPDTGIKIRQLIDRIISLKNESLTFNSQQNENIPFYSSWVEFGKTVSQLSEALEETGAEAAFAEHPFSHLNDSLFQSDNPIRLLENSIHQSKNALQEISNTIRECNIDHSYVETLSKLKALIEDSVLLNQFAQNDNLGLINPSNPANALFETKLKSYKEHKKKHQIATEANNHWINKLSAQDLDSAISIAAKNENSFLNFLSGEWKRLKKQLQSSYDFSQHQIAPSISNILQNLSAEYNSSAELATIREQLEKEFRLHNIETTCRCIDMISQKRGDKEVDYLLNHPNVNNVVKRLYQLNDTIHKLETNLRQILLDYESRDLSDLTDQLESLAINADGLPDLLPALRQYAVIEPKIKKLLRDFPLSPGQAEAAMAHKSLDQFYNNNRAFANTDASAIEKAVQIIHECYKRLMKLNANLIRATIRYRFIRHLETSNTALSQLTPEEKQFKKNFTEGRKILENEFAKSMRYKSIRELSTKDSGLVLKDLKPVWLMSPLSVSDSLPLDTNYFDVVIFDEASQITLEEGVPALYRSPQTIIVGDDKQMPPTNFFSAKAEDPDDLMQLEDEEEDEILSADADSLLAQGARKLSSTMLSWHYRSRYETLISYSNHAFYDAGLLTIPDKTIHHTSKSVIEVNKPEDAEGFAENLFDRSMSFHFHPNSIYEKRGNINEAEYIASLIRVLLKKKIKESIGIVAFSQEQQHVIEDCLTSLAAQDKEFEQLLEEAYTRTEDDQFVGLIIKNLENIQGDERDIIIMSVCYGFDARRKILMNFGPVNKKGGEKRLNVIFSRAKKHMAVVSSIKYHHITNEYNEGANYFRRFLQYAENISLGEMSLARTILDSLVAHKKEISEKPATTTVVIKQVKEALEECGYGITEQVGQSDFKCSLSVTQNPGDTEYLLSILIDDERHYQNDNLLELFYQRPAILQSFGWRTIRVFAKDWFQQPKKVIEQIIKRIKGEEAPIVEDLDIMLPSEVLPEPEKQTSISPATTVTGYEHLSFERFIFVEGTSSKFWETASEGVKLIVRFGRIGTKGQVQIKTFADEAQVNREKEKMIREKTGKGYIKQD